jgi:hypothetical protein
MAKPQLTQSMLDMMSRCGLQFQYRYGYKFDCYHEEIIMPPGVALVIGSSVHAGVEKCLQHKIETGNLADHEEVMAAVEDTFNGIASKELMLTPDEASNIKQTISDARDDARGLATLHYGYVAPGIFPVAVEEPFVIELKDYPYDLSGKMDIREINSIRDTKTRAQTPSEDAARSMQLATYSLAHKTIHGHYP